TSAALRLAEKWLLVPDLWLEKRTLMRSSSRTYALTTRPDSFFRKCISLIAAWAMLISTMPTYGARAGYPPPATNRLSASFYSTKGDPLLGNRQSRLLGPDFLMPIGTTTHRNSSASTLSSTVSGQGAGIPLQIASLRGRMGKAFLSSTLSPTML